MVLAGVLAKTRPRMASSAGISRFPSIGQIQRPEKLGLLSPSTAPRTHQGRVLSLPIQVPFLSFPRERHHLTYSHRWAWRVWGQLHPNFGSNPQQPNWRILRYCFLGSKGCWFHNVCHVPCILYIPLAYPLVQPRSDKLLQLS